MAMRMAEHLFRVLDGLRYEPTTKRVRALLGGQTAVDSTRAVLVWEPERVVPQYAVPVEDVLAELHPAPSGTGDRRGPGAQALGPAGVQVLTPETGFGVHTSEGEPLTIRIGDAEGPGAGFRPLDPDLAGHVILDFDAFDGWLEEDEEIVSHPRDPFHRVDVRRSSRHVRIELDGHVLADSTRPTLLFETNLPQRYYLPVEDLDTSLLRPSDTITACAYKGVAQYRTVELPGRTMPDLVWTYPAPLPDAMALTDLLCFFTERVDVVLDGIALQRPVSPWS